MCIEIVRWKQGLLTVFHFLDWHSFRSQKELLIGGVKEITVRVEVENKAQDAAYPGKVIVTYPSVIDYVSSQVGRCEKIVFQHSLEKFRGVSGFYEGVPTNFRRNRGL